MNKKPLVVIAALLLSQLMCVQVDQVSCDLRGGKWRTEVRSQSEVEEWCEMPAAAGQSGTPATTDPTPANTLVPTQTHAVNRATPATPAGPALDCNATTSLQVEAVLDYDKEVESGRHCLYRLRVTNAAERELVFFWHRHADNDIHSFTPGWESRVLAPGEPLELEFDAFYWTNGVWSYYLADRVAAIVNSDTCNQQVNPEAGLAALDALALDIQYYCGP